MDLWQKYVCENILAVLDPVQNESRAGVTQMLGLISLCMPTNEQGQSRELLMQFLRVASLMVSPPPLAPILCVVDGESTPSSPHCAS